MGRHVSKEHKQLILRTLFENGVLHAVKDKFAKSHVTLASVHNLDVFLTLVSQKCVSETFSWGHYYWKLTDEGIVRLRQILGIPADQVPYTHKKSAMNIGTFGDAKESMKQTELDKERTVYNETEETQSLVLPEKFQHILRIYNTNVHGDLNIGIALTCIKGIGRRFANVLLKKAGIPTNKRAGELSNEEIEKLMEVAANPLNFNIPKWMLNRQHDPRDGKYVHLVSNQLDARLRDDIIRLKKIRCNRGLRHYWGLKVRGQHTRTTGRRGHAVGFSKKKA